MLVGLLKRVWSYRVPSAAVPTAYHVAWTVLSLAVVILLPQQIVAGLSFWNAPAADAAYSLLMGGIFVAVALLFSIETATHGAIRVAVAGIGALVCYVAAMLLLIRHPNLRFLGPAAAMASAVGIPLALAPYLLRRFRGVALVVLGGAAAALTLTTTPRAGDVAPRFVPSALVSLSVATHDDLIPTPAMDGGGITAYRDGLVVITGDGLMYRVVPSADGTPRATALDLPAPFDRSSMSTTHPAPNTARLRATDVIAEPGTDRVYVAHQNWDADARCFTIRVSSIDLQARGRWTSIFDSSPCLQAAQVLDDSETGGSLAWLDGRLLLTVGDHGHDGRRSVPFSQHDDNSYGKVIEIDPSSGAHRVFTTGHRNPQGLVTASSGHVWLTEHGPSGGDELNLLEAGKNYGWPFATYGADYGTHFWPLAPTAPNHAAFTEPAYAFVPSVAVASVIEVTSPRFTRWQRDLLVGALRTRTLFRVRLRDTRVVYVEPLPIGREIRDLAEGPDGRIYVWTDDGGDVLTIAPSDDAATGPAAFVRCGVCHEAGVDGERSAPLLRGIIGRKVAAEPGFIYSPALAGLGGEWTEDRLDAFLADPAGYAPGSRMDIGRVTAAAERRAIIEFLKTYR